MNLHHLFPSRWLTGSCGGVERMSRHDNLTDGSPYSRLHVMLVVDISSIGKAYSYTLDFTVHFNLHGVGL
jgi:hypothetical protein